LNEQQLKLKAQIEHIMGEDGALSKYIPNYETRPSQLEGVEAIVTSLREGKNFILEGPCGYGKSPTYLISAMLDIIESGHRCVVATAGITLQEQLYYKDIPAIIKAINDVTGTKLTYSYLKGRNNFICMRKAEELNFEHRGSVSKPIAELLAWYAQTKTGDMSELNYIPEYQDWSEIACVDSDECQGKQCSFYNECYYQKRKIQAKNADIVVCNYHVLFSDIKIGPSLDGEGGVLLGDYGLLVCDEAHEMAKIARDFLEIKVSYYTFTNIQRKITTIVKKYGERIDMSQCGITEMLENAKSYFLEITDKFDFSDKDSLKIIAKGTKIPYGEFLPKIRHFENKIKEHRERICPFGEEELLLMHNDEEGKAIIKALDGIIEKLLEIADTLVTICNQSNDKMSYWFEKDNNSLLSMHAKPVKVNGFLNENIFDKTGLRTIVTSATLSINRSFDYIKNELGIENTNEMIAPSPFNLKEQQLWYLPKNAVDGNDYENFNRVMIKNLEEIIEACYGGVLCLFTSISNMNYAANILRRKLPDYYILKQGDAPRHVLLDEFKGNLNSILFGTKSFFTGVDIKGPALRCVVIDKFPFESPGDPIMSVLANEDNGFYKYFIPDMIITLKQAIGRSIRDKDDKCVVVVLDNRLATARYKARVANSFTYEKTATRNIEDVKDFIDKYIKSLPNDMPF